MQLPEELETILKRDLGLHGSVLSATRSFEYILEDNKMPFFPEYTDHGVKHVESVISTAQELIRNQAWDYVTAADAAVLVVACLLHDAAMHITEDGFIALIKQTDVQLNPLWKEDLPWPELWIEFLGEASRFDGRMLKSMFGTTDPVVRPTIDPALMTTRDKLLIGEFLRRHHSRLAQEIAAYGFPGPDKNKLRLDALPTYVSQLAGIVARSHGMPLRMCIPHLEPDFDKREYKGVHAPFLMSLIRVSDYLQIDAARAPRELHRIKRLRSPNSIREWSSHDAIDDIRYVSDDPEAVYIQAQPKSIKTYLRIKEWLTGIQDELDTSWAVIGEIYGRIQRLNQLGLTIRRVQSNLDDVESFASNVKYVPIHASFQAANPDLLKLLIGPLYDNRPDIGVRELVQNAVDAVRELKEYINQQPNIIIDSHELPPNVDVLVRFDEHRNGRWMLTIQDRGIGMTAETIQEYFLKAGASYRNSDAWRNKFEDSRRRSRVLRSGRFGVGALAAFLLGDEIEVRTRYVDSLSSEGIWFRTTLEDESIELKKVTCPVGTMIRVKVKPDIAHQINEWFKEWPGPNPDGYCLGDPSVLRVVKRADNDNADSVGQHYLLPSPGTAIEPGWGRIAHNDYKEIHWTYESVPAITCNGIIVIRQQEEAPDTWWSAIKKEPLNPPSISVFDPNGVFPVNLQRTGLAQSSCPFGDALVEDIVKDFLAFTIVRGPTSSNSAVLNSKYRYTSRYLGFRLSKYNHPLFFTHNGYSLSFPWHIRNASLNCALLLTVVKGLYGPAYGSIDLSIPHNTAIFATYLDKNEDKYDTAKLMRFMQSNRSSYPATKYDPFALGLSRLPVNNASFAITTRFGRDIVKQKTSALPKNIKNQFWSSNDTDAQCWHTENCSAAINSLEKLLNIGIKSDHDTVEFVAEWQLSRGNDYREPQTDSSVIERLWKNIIGHPVIPYDMEKRREQLDNAYKELGPYIKRHEALFRQENE